MESLDVFLNKGMWVVVWVFGVVAGLALAWWVSVKIYKYWMRFRVVQSHKNGVLLKVTLPKHRHLSDAPNEKTAQTKTKTNVAEQMFAELHGIIPSDWKKHLVFRDTLSFEIVATATEINFYVFVSKRLTNFVKSAIFAAYSEAEIVEVEDYFESFLKRPYESGYVRLIGPQYGPIRTYETMVNDSLNPLLNKMVNLRGEEMLAIQYYLTPVTGSWRKKVYSYLNYLRNSQDIEAQKKGVGGNETATAWVGDTPQLAIDKDLYSGLEKKMGKQGFLVGIRVLSAASSKNEALANFDSMARSFSQFNTQPLTVFQSCQFWLGMKGLPRCYKQRVQPLIDWPFFRQQFVANTEEMASLFHFPGEEISSPKVSWQKYKTALIGDVTPEKGLFLGYNSFRGEKKKVFMSKEDRRRHFYIVGQTGVGKSVYMENMFLQDVRNGDGACFIDPHGDVAESILTKIPKERVKDVVYWNPGDTEYPMGMNIMDVETEENKNIIINSFIALLYKLYDPNRTGMMGPMLERTIRNVMLTAMSEKGSTLIEALRLLTSPEFAKSKIETIKDPILKTYWTEEMARTTDFHKSETLGYYVSKFDRFVSDVTIRNIIGQSRSSVDFAKIMNEGKILVVNLSKGTLGEENAAFLGTLIIPKFLVAAMGRSKIAEEKRKDFYLYVDEFQNFATPDFVGILSEARKYRLNLVVGNQYISQIREDVRDAVFGNVGSVGSFRVGVDDAKYLVNHYAPVISEFDLINNGIGNMYLRMLVNGKPTDSFSVALDWNEVSAVTKDVKIAQIIKRVSRLKYAKPKSVVEFEIMNRAGLV
ncbi:type IV secretion system DNA-binding domain-containing protein [Patescibacteria group bacterium]|nr:type IV secretion system DNA-binding domain-containing protein [Patescibacteria group bacterium]MBU1457274.1 type IV secretion system DNA-binding domain-containing protein [Patescibacteria group bacterium]